MSGNLQTVARVRCGQQSISNSGHFSRQIAISEEYNCHTFLLISKDVKLSTKNMIVLKVRYIRRTHIAVQLLELSDGNHWFNTDCTR